MSKVARLEAVLALPDNRPLAHVDFTVDPLDGIAAVCAQAGEGEQVGAMIGLLPVSPRTLRRRIPDRHHGRNLGGGIVGDLASVAGVDGLFGPGPRRRTADVDPVALAAERVETRQQVSKLTAGGPVLALQVLIRAEAPSKQRAWKLAYDAAAWLAVWSGENRLVPRRVRGRHRVRFDWSWSTGAFAPRRPQLVTMREVVGFIRPPGKKCQAPVLRSATGLGAPDDIASYEGQPAGVLPLGRVITPEGAELVGVRKADTLFSLIAGGSGMGKTETALNQAIHLIRAGAGVWYVDPHGDALDRMKPYICERHVAGRLVELNLGVEQDTTPTWNLLSMAAEKAQHGTDLHSPGLMAAMERKGAVLEASFSASQKWDERNTRAKNLTVQAARSLLELAVLLPDELAPTVFQLRTLLANGEWRAAVVPHLSPALQEFWTTTFDKLAGEAITPITNLIDYMRASSAVVGMFGASVSTFDPRRSIDAGQVVLVCPDANDSVAGIVANFFVYGLRSALLSRRDTAPEDRVPVWAFLDEAQAYDSASSGTLAAMLEQARKFGLHATFMTQNPERLSPKTLQALSTNRSHLITHALGDDGAKLMAAEMSHGTDPDTIKQLPKFVSMASVRLFGELTAPFEVHGVAVPDLWARVERPVAEVAALNRRAQGNVEHRPVAEVAAHQASLPERIVDWLAEHGPGPRRARLRTA